MCTLLYILLVNICIFISVKSESAIKEFHMKNEASPPPNITIDEYQKIHIIFGGIYDELVDNVSCKGSCTVGDKNVSTTCHQKRGSDQNIYLDVSITTKLTTRFAGRWNCHYIAIKIVHGPNETERQSIGLDNRFHLNVTPHLIPQASQQSPAVNWIYIGAGIGVLVILVIIGQTICIIYFKKKAIAAQRHARMSHDTTKDEDRTAPAVIAVRCVNSRFARYSSPPKKVEDAHEARESGIYEVLEHVKGPPPPPRNNAKQSSLERIKKRPPIPAPSQEVNEALPDKDTSPEPTPLPIRKLPPNRSNRMEAKKKPIPEPKPKNEPQETPSVSRKPLHGMGMPIPGMSGPIGGGVPNELKEALRQRQNTMSQKQGEPTPPKPLPKRTPKPTRDPAPVSPTPWTEQPTLNMERPWLKESPQTKLTPWSQEPPILAKEKQWSPKPKKEKWVPESPASQRYTDRAEDWQDSLKSKGRQKAIDRDDSWQHSMERKGTKVTRIPMNPGLPPANAPPAKLVTPVGEALPPKPKYSPKPIQLHPLPKPPLPEPGTIRVRTAHCDSVDDDDDEFEVYDDLESFNLYSI